MGLGAYNERRRSSWAHGRVPGPAAAASSTKLPEQAEFEALLMQDLDRINAFYVQKLATFKTIWASLRDKVPYAATSKPRWLAGPLTVWSGPAHFAAAVGRVATHRRRPRIPRRYQRLREVHKRPSSTRYLWS